MEMQQEQGGRILALLRCKPCKRSPIAVCGSKRTRPRSNRRTPMEQGPRFSADGTKLISGSGDTAALVFDPASVPDPTSQKLGGRQSRTRPAVQPLLDNTSDRANRYPT